MIKRVIYSVLLLTFVLFSTTGCEKYLDVNKNEDAPVEIPGYLYLAGILQSYQGMYYDIRATGPITQMMGTTSSSFTNFATHYAAQTDNGAEIFRMTYWLQGMNLENLINQSIENEDWTLAGIGYAIKAFSWDQMTKINGELPMKEAFEPGRLTFDYDYQNVIYAQVRNWAYTAIKYLEMEDNHDYSTTISKNDYIYYGDKAKWIKFAYGVLVRNYISLSNKTNFATTYADSVIYCAERSFASPTDDATLKIAGGSDKAAYGAYNNFWGTNRGNLSRVYFQHEYAVQVMTGSVPYYDESTGNKVTVTGNTYYPYQLAAKQIVCDTAIFTQTGHFDPRIVLKLGTTSDPTYQSMNDIKAIKKFKYYGGSFTSTSGSIGTAPSYYGRNASSLTTLDGAGRWLYHDNAPYILMTYAELKFDVAEAYWKKGDKPNALAAFKDGVKADLTTTGRYITPGTSGSSLGGDHISATLYNTAATEYAAGPFVDGLLEADFTLSHIMMQKWVALYPWGASEAWVDMRKYHYDIVYTGDYPYFNNGWDLNTMTQKWDTDPTKVFKGLYLPSAQVQGRKIKLSSFNSGSPCYRFKPRYNSEYMWNRDALSVLKPIAGTADNYHCSIQWFAYPGDMPESVPTGE